SLNHPNIASIYGLEESGGVRALVMELVEGPTLAERIATRARGDSAGAGLAPPARAQQAAPLPLDEALGIAKQIAEALEAAHERGIVHRDLKPANIKVTEEGTVKVLDFGLAKAFNPQDSAANLNETNSPTLSMAATQAGVILGTAAYMSPEQARGKPVDKRTDIWSFGCVLYETLTGRQAFAAETVSDTIAAILGRDPDWQALPAETPANIRVLLRRCLQKDFTRRLRDIGDARIEIEEALDPSRAIPVIGAVLAEPRAARRRRAITWSLAALAALSIGALVWSLLRATAPPTRPIVRLSVALPPSDRLALGLTPVVALSPDGSRLVYVANHSGAQQLYVRPIDRLEATAIPGTEGAESPFFSPDGQWLGFFAEGKLKKVSLSGGAPLTLCSAPLNRGASWGPDDNIILTLSFGVSGLFQVSAAGGTPKPLTIPDGKKGEGSHRWPEILPGGKAVLFTNWGGGSFDDARIAVQSLETGERRTLLEGGTYARYVPSGHLVYARARGLLAVPFDLKRLEVTGAPVSILEGVSMSSTGAAQFSFSGDGSLAYVSGGLGIGERTLLWVDRKGAAQPIPAPSRGYISPRLSPDGQRLAVGIQTTTHSGVWLYDLARGTLTRLAETALVPFPFWTPDGKGLTVNLAQQGPLNLFWMAADGGAVVERLTTSEGFQVPGSWSPNGEVLAFSEMDPTTGWDI
ncbi:MAG TPA: protein kinase, partial [Candidatus Binatia bacterium]|nr:protein kinase [Candidatus Binatia bacterium]